MNTINEVREIVLEYKRSTLAMSDFVLRILALFPGTDPRPFNWLQFKDFLGQEIRRKGEKFKDEIWTVKGLSPSEVYIETISDDDFIGQWKSYAYLFEEYEFIDGGVFGK